MIRELHQQLVDGSTTALRLTEKYFAAIKEKDAEIGAFLTLLEESAFAQADRVDQKIKKGEFVDLLAGIPCAIKDVLCVQGVRTTAASRVLDNYIAPYDATVIARLKAADAVMVGKTNTDEFAMGSSTENSAYQVTHNPHDPARVAGGSSGGSAAAVAAGEAVWALGSDTGGSVRQPSSFCGTVGLKPTYGRVSRYGLIAMASSLDQIGTLSHSAEDAAIILSRIAGHDPKDATSAPSGDKRYEDYLTGDLRGKVIGVPKEYVAEGLDARIKEKFYAAVEKFKNAGAIVKEISLPHMEYALATYYIIMPSEVSSNMARYDGIRYGMRSDDRADEEGSVYDVYCDTRRYGLGAEVKRRVMLGTYTLSAGYYDAYYRTAQKVRTLLRKDFEAALRDVHLIFSPTAPEVAFPIGAKTNDPLTMYLSDIYTITANLVGVPALSFPIGTVEENGKQLPVGGQLMGKWFDEEGLLNAAHTFEHAQ